MTISCEGEMKDVTPMNYPSTTGWSLNKSCWKIGEVTCGWEVIKPGS